MSKKRSALWTIQDLSERTRRSFSFSEILKGLGLRAEGGNIRTLKSVLVERGIDYSHLRSGRGANRGRVLGPSPFRVSREVLVADSSTARSVVRRLVLRDGLVPYRCAVCSQEPLWRGSSLSLVLDHINGVFNDHRIENLRFLCPNCNSQQETFAGRRKSYIGESSSGRTEGFDPSYVGSNPTSPAMAGVS